MKAAALRLQQERSQRERQVDVAKWNVEHGEAPNEEARAEWLRLERRTNQIQERSLLATVEVSMKQSQDSVKVRAGWLTAYV